MDQDGGQPRERDDGGGGEARAPKVDGRAPSLPGAPAPPRPRPVAGPPAAPRVPGPATPRVPTPRPTPPAAPSSTAAPGPATVPAPDPAPVAAPDPAPVAAADPAPVAAAVALDTRADTETRTGTDTRTDSDPGTGNGTRTGTDEAPADPAALAIEAPARPRPSVPPADPPPALGSSLHRDPLPGDASPRRRRGNLPTPPRPPFREDQGEYAWSVQLPSSLFRTITVRVGDDALEIGGTRVVLDDITEVRIKLDVEAALVRKAASARMALTLTLEDGSTVRVSARNAASSRRATAIVETLSYLWTVLGDTAGADQRAQLVEKVERGQEVQIGRLRLTSIGVAWKRNPIARWSTLGDPTRDGLDVVIPVDGEDPIVVPLTDDDAYMLPALVPALRRRFG